MAQNVYEPLFCAKDNTVGIMAAISGITYSSPHSTICAPDIISMEKLVLHPGGVINLLEPWMF